MTLHQSRISNSPFRKCSGMGIMEVMIGIAILGGVIGLMLGILGSQAKSRRASEIRVSLESLHIRAQHALKRFLSVEMDNFINSGLNIKNCFDAKGSNCDSLNIDFPGYSGAAPGNREFEMNRMMNGDYTLMGEPCTVAPCPVQVRTVWDMNCQSMSCTDVKINTSVTLNNAAISNEDKALVSNVPVLSSENIYNKTRRIGLVRNLATSCDVPTTANLVSNVMGCSGVSADNENELFDTNLGINYLNGGVRLVATGGVTTTTTGGNPPTEPLNCPACTRAVMTDNGLECKSSVLCTNPGWVVRGCNCCNPTIPNGGNGWGPWSACSKTCGNDGVQTRTCLYPKEDGYCDSTCSRNDSPQSQACNRTPCTCDNGAVNWPACDRCPGNSCMKWKSQSDHSLVCKVNDEADDNGGSGNGNFKHTYVMGSWDRTEFARCKNCQRCSIKVNRKGGRTGGSGDQDEVTVECSGKYKFQLRRNRCG